MQTLKRFLTMARQQSRCQCIIRSTSDRQWCNMLVDARLTQGHVEVSLYTNDLRVTHLLYMPLGLQTHCIKQRGKRRQCGDAGWSNKDKARRMKHDDRACTASKMQMCRSTICCGDAMWLAAGKGLIICRILFCAMQPLSTCTHSMSQSSMKKQHQ